MNKMLMFATLASAISTVGLGGIIVHQTLTIERSEPAIPANQTPVVQIDEDRIAERIVAGLVDAQRAEASERAELARKKNCDFFGPSMAPGC